MSGKPFGNKVFYAQMLCFECNTEDGNLPRTLIEAQRSGKPKSCVFVNSKDEAKGFGDDVIVAWPASNTKKILTNLNREIIDVSTNLKPCSLSYPVTLADMTEEWKNVADLFGRLDEFTQGDVLYLDSAK